MSDYPEAERFEYLMVEMLEPDNEKIRNATAEMNRLVKSPRCVLKMFQVIMDSKDGDIKKMAAVLLRMKILGHWGKLDAEMRENLKREMISILMSDSIRNDIRKALADLTALVARVEVADNNWPDVLDFIYQCTQQESADHRAMGLYLFKEMMENVENLVSMEFDALHKVVYNGLIDAVPDVRVAAMGAVAPFVDFLNSEEQNTKFGELIGPLIENIKFCLDNGGEEYSQEGFEVFHLLIDEAKFEVLENCAGGLFEFCQRVGCSEGLELETRKSTFYNSSLLDPTLDCIFQLLRESEESDEEMDSAHTAGTSLLDAVCIHLPMKLVYPPLKERVIQHLDRPEVACKKAGLSAIGIMSEGCGESVMNDIEGILGAVVGGLDQQEDSVRKAACFALGEMSKQLQPEICRYHGEVVPRLLQLLPTRLPDMIIARMLHAYQQFTEHLIPEEVEPYIKPRCLALFLEGSHNAQALEIFFTLVSGQSELVQNLVFPSISATCLAAKDLFNDFVIDTMRTMEPFLFNTNPERALLRARALECAGIIAISQGAQLFEPFLKQTMEVARELAEHEDSDVREYTFSFFGHVAQVLGDGFLPYTEYCVEQIFKRCSSRHGISIQSEKEVWGGIERAKEDIDLADCHVAVAQSFTDELSTCLRALGTICRSIGIGYERYLGLTLDLFEKLCGDDILHIEVEIRAACLRACADVIEGVCMAYQRPQYPSWEKGQDQPLHPNLVTLLDWFMPRVEMMSMADEEYEAVLAALESLRDVVQCVGPAVLIRYPSVFRGHEKLLTKEAEALMQRPEQFLDTDDDDLDFNLFNATSINLVQLFQVGGSALVQYIPHFFTLIEPYFRESLSTDYHLVSLGTIAELLRECGPEGSRPFALPTMERALQGIASEEPTYRRNGAFTIRILFELAPAEIAAVPQWDNAVLGALRSVFRDDEQTVVVENACAALCAVAMAFPDVIDADDVVGVLMKALPLTEDHECAACIFTYIGTLLKNNFEKAKPHIPGFVAMMFMEVCAPEFEVFEDLHTIIPQCLQLVRDAGMLSEIQAIAMSQIGSLEDDQKARMQSILAPLL